MPLSDTLNLMIKVILPMIWTYGIKENRKEPARICCIIFSDDTNTNQKDDFIIIRLTQA